MKKSGVKVVAPVSIGRISGQIDLLGLAIDKTLLEIVVTPNTESNEFRFVELTGFTKKQKESDLQETAILGAKALFAAASLESVGVDIKIHIKTKNLPRTTYVSALFLTGAIAMNELFRRPLTRRELLSALGAQCADITTTHSEIAPLVIGGITTTHSLHPCEVHRLIIPKGIQVTYITNISDKSLGSLEIEQESRVISSLIHGLAMSSFNFIKRALKDQSVYFPDFLNQILELNQDLDLLGAIYLNASNSAIIFSVNTLVSDAVHERVQKYWDEKDNRVVVLTHPIQQEGIQLM